MNSVQFKSSSLAYNMYVHTLIQIYQNSISLQFIKVVEKLTGLVTLYKRLGLVLTKMVLLIYAVCLGQRWSESKKYQVILKIHIFMRTEI